MSEAFSQLELPDSVVARARAGELAAFEQIYRRFERPVFTLALRMLHDAEAAREVLHDAMLKVFQRIGQYRSDAPFWAWLRQIAANEALMRLRREQRFEPEPEADDLVDGAAVGARRRARARACARTAAGGDPQRALALPRRRLFAS